MQHVEFPLAFVIAEVFFFFGVTYVIGLLDALETALNAHIAGDSQLGEAKLQEMLANSAVVFRLVRGGLEHRQVLVAAITTASAMLLAVYLFGCGRFRLRLVSWSLAALAVVAVVCFVGMYQAAQMDPYTPANAPDRDASQTHYAQWLFFLSTFVFFAALLLLAVRGVLVLRLWRHRLRPDLPRTHRMTRSLGVNLAMPKFTWARISASGVAVHIAVLLGLGTLVYLFPRWILIALISGATHLFFLLFETPRQIIVISARLLQGQPLLLSNELSSFAGRFDDLPSLVLVASVLVAAGAVWRIGRRLNLRRRNEIILRDKPPVLLLRSFTDDVAGIPSNMLLSRLFWRRKRLEEMIGGELTRAGPFVAIGKPGETLPQIGASRLYLADSEWQAVVQSYIARSEPVIVIAGKTHWVQWELANVIAQDRVAKLLIVFPRITEAERAERWQNLKPAFDNTPWADAAKRIDIARTLAVFVASNGELVVVRSRKAHESDYQAALRIAIYLMHQGTASG